MAQTVYYGREYEEEKERQEMIKEQAEALTMAMKTIVRQPEKNALRDPGEKGWACFFCGKEGNLFRHQATPSSMSSLQGTTLAETLPPEA